MDKTVKLKSVLKILCDAAKEADQKADKFIGVDNDMDVYYQGLRNGYLQAVKLLKKKVKHL